MILAIEHIINQFLVNDKIGYQKIRFFLIKIYSYAYKRKNLVALFFY